MPGIIVSEHLVDGVSGAQSIARITAITAP